MRPASPAKTAEAGAVPLLSAPAHPLAAQVDELGELEKELAPLQFKIRRAEGLRAAIRAHYAEQPANEPFEAKGTRWTVLVGPRAPERKVNLAQLAKQVTYKKFVTLATVTLKALAALDTGVAAQCVASAPTGPRTLKVLELGA